MKKGRRSRPALLTGAPFFALTGFLALACSERTAADVITPDMITSRAGCYDVYPGNDTKWLPASWRKVDTLTADRVHLVLGTEPDTSGPHQPAFAVDGGQSQPWVGHYIWWPTSRGLRISQAGVDTEFEIDLAGDSVLLQGTGRSDGMIEGGAYRYPVVARRRACEGFVPGFTAGSDAS